MLDLMALPDPLPALFSRFMRQDGFTRQEFARGLQVDEVEVGDLLALLVSKGWVREGQDATEGSPRFTIRPKPPTSRRSRGGPDLLSLLDL